MENFKNYGVQELNAKEIKKVNGGWVIEVIGAAIYLYNEGGDFLSGASAGYNRARYGGGASGSW